MLMTRRTTLAAAALATAAVLSGCGSSSPSAPGASTPVQTGAAPGISPSVSPAASPSRVPTRAPAAPPAQTSRPTSGTPTSTAPDTSTSSATRSSKRAKQTAADLVRSLAVKGRAPKTGYSREQFGASWVDVDGNDCDTRDDILRRDLTSVTPAGGCTVTSGTLADPYGGTTIDYVRGASKVDIDHVVALSDAWQKGAAQWPYAKRVAFANDPVNLLAVSASLNRQKGDADAATWLPPRKAYRCAYVAHQARVKSKYGVWVTSAEREAMLRVLDACPGQVAPGPGSSPTLAPGVGEGPSTGTGSGTGSGTGTGTGSGTGAGTGDGAVDPDYGTCAAAKAAGKGPYYKDKDPEYAYYRDADGDGVVCE